MKIAVNTRFLLKGKLEGIGWVTYELLKRMVVQHPEDEFLFFFDRPFSEAFIFADNVKGYVLFPPARHPLLWYAWFEIAIPRALKQHQPDVFLSTDSYLSLRTTVKTAMICHDIAHVHFPQEIPFLVNQYYQFFVPRFLRRAERIISVSHFTKQDIIQHYGIEAQKIEVVHNGCRDGFSVIEEQAKTAIKNQYSKGEDFFFYVGAVHPRKNVHRLIEAFDQFKQRTSSSIQLLIGGRFAWQTGPVKTAFDQAQHQKDIHFLGYLSESDLKQIMASALVFVYPSLFEGFGIPVLEAMHCGVPVISSQVSSLPEVTGDAGILIDPNSVEELTTAMSKIYDDTDFRKQLITKGQEQKKQFNWDRSAKEVYQVLKKMADEKI